jgi:hypothetical protein
LFTTANWKIAPPPGLELPPAYGRDTRTHSVYETAAWNEIQIAGVGKASVGRGQECSTDEGESDTTNTVTDTQESSCFELGQGMELFRRYAFKTGGVLQEISVTMRDAIWYVKLNWKLVAVHLSQVPSETLGGRSELEFADVHRSSVEIVIPPAGPGLDPIPASLQAEWCPEVLEWRPTLFVKGTLVRESPEWADVEADKDVADLELTSDVKKSSKTQLATQCSEETESILSTQDTEQGSKLQQQSEWKEACDGKEVGRHSPEDTDVGNKMGGRETTEADALCQECLEFCHDEEFDPRSEAVIAAVMKDLITCDQLSNVVKSASQNRPAPVCRERPIYISGDLLAGPLSAHEIVEKVRRVLYAQTSLPDGVGLINVRTRKDNRWHSLRASIVCLPPDTEDRVCWDLLNKGVCPRRKQCRWYHPQERDITKIKVIITTQPSETS